MDAMQLIEAKKAETAKRAAKLRAQLDAAEAELHNLEITADTLTRLNLNPIIETAAPRGQSFNHIFGVLGDNLESGKTPKEIHDALNANGVTSITQDNVRTILSRHKDRLGSSDGRYWRKVEQAEPPHDDLSDLLGDPPPQKENEPHSTSAGGSDAREFGASPPPRDFGNSPTWPRETS